MIQSHRSRLASRLSRGVRRRLSISSLPRVNRSAAPKALLYSAVATLSLALIYFYVIGRDRYQVTSSVLVRKSTETAAPSFSLGSLVGGGNLESLEDARYLRTYLTSPQVLEDLDKRLNFRSVYARKGLDFFPGVWPGASREEVFEVFKRQISVGLDEVSGELKIATYGFEAKTALDLNRFLIDQSERFVNRLNQDVYRQQLDFTKQQVSLNARRVKEATLELQNFQRVNKLLDAKVVAQGNEQFIGALEAELAKQRVQLATLQRQFSDPKAPEIEAVNAQVQELQAQIRKERGALVSRDGKNLNEKALQLAELEANLLFATDLYKAALSSAEKTRVDSLQQQRFMALLSKPLLPEDPWQYWRHKGFLTALAVVIIVFTLTKFLLGMADSHRG